MNEMCEVCGYPLDPEGKCTGQMSDAAYHNLSEAIRLAQENALARLRQRMLNDLAMRSVEEDFYFKKDALISLATGSLATETEDYLRRVTNDD